MAGILPAFGFATSMMSCREDVWRHGPRHGSAGSFEAETVTPNRWTRYVWRCNAMVQTPDILTFLLFKSVLNKNEAGIGLVILAFSSSFAWLSIGKLMLQLAQQLEVLGTQNSSVWKCVFVQSEAASQRLMH